MIKKQQITRFLVSSLTLFLSACSGDNSDLMSYINEVKSRSGQPIEEIPKFAPLPIFKFPEHDTRRSPFKPVVLKAADEYAPDQKRMKEPLEAFPLDALKFVGILKQGSDIWALIKAPDNKITPLKIGGYMGQNYGRIIAIKNDEIKLEETLRNSGKWEKNITTLNLDTGK
jgi:type IV pilus assembly protein PilP